MRRILLLIPVLVLSLASLAAAQPAPPPAGAPPDGNSWKTPAAAVIFAGFIIAVSIMKSKREHRD